MTWTWSNTTYYDDDGLLHLIERIVAAANGLTPPPGHPAQECLVHSFPEVWIRYATGGNRVSANLEIRRDVDGRRARDPERLRVSIARRTELFGSDLETVAGLAGHDPRMPPEVVGQLSSVILEAISVQRALPVALRQEYPKSTEGKTWRWPDNCARDFVREHIIPCCEVVIHDRAKVGSAYEEKLLSAKESVFRRTQSVESARKERLRIQSELEGACMVEEKAQVGLATAWQRLSRLESKPEKGDK